MAPKALLSLRRKSCYGFFSLVKICRPPPGLILWTLGPVVSTIIITPLRHFNAFCATHISLFQNLRHCDEKQLSDIRKHVLLMSSISTSTYRCEKMCSLVKNVNLICVFLINTWKDTHETEKRERKIYSEITCLSSVTNILPRTEFAIEDHWVICEPAWKSNLAAF
jgi:hypothetical protein